MFISGGERFHRGGTYCSTRCGLTTLDNRSFILHEAWMKEDWQAVKDRFSKNGQNGCIVEKPWFVITLLAYSYW